MTRTILESATNSALEDVISLTLLEQVNRLAEEYRHYAKATAEGILKLAETLVRAENELGQEGFADFLNAVGLKGRETTVSKHRTIGKATKRLRTIGENLPNSWTTLYELARLTPETFDDIKGEIAAHMTAAELHGLLPRKTGGARPAKSKSGSHVPIATISIRFGGGESLAEFLEALNVLKQRFSFEFDAPAAVPADGIGSSEPLQEAA